MNNFERFMIIGGCFHCKGVLDSKNRPICKVKINGRLYDYYLGPDANGVIFSSSKGEYISVGNELRWWRGIIDKVPSQDLISGLRDFSFSIIKPDAIKRGIDQNIRRGIRNIGLRIEAEKEILMDKKSLFQLYPYFFEESWEEMLVSYFCSSPMICLLIVGKNSAKTLLEFRNLVRSVYRNRGDHPIVNLFHAADSTVDAFREASLFFRENDLIKIIGRKE